jgi:hypothetical protein
VVKWLRVSEKRIVTGRLHEPLTIYIYEKALTENFQYLSRKKKKVAVGKEKGSFYLFKEHL